MAGLIKSLFRKPTYRRYLVLGDSRTASFWNCSNWTTHVFPVLDGLLKLGSCSPSVHCRQVTGPTSKEVRFGRLEWSPENSREWCHSPKRSQTAAWLFVDLQVYCPAKQQLIKEDELPSIYFQVQPMGRKDYAGKAIFDQSIHVAIREEIVTARRDDVESEVSKLSRLPGALALYEATSKVAALNAFESLVREDFVYRGILDSELPDVQRMSVKWSRIGGT